MKKRKILITLIVLLVVGFASVSTTLFINGIVGIASNESDFNIIFTSSKLNNIQRNDFIEPEKKQTLTFETNKLTTVDEKAVLDYEVTNTSRLYDADIEIVCNMVDEQDNVVENNEYIIISYQPNSMIVEAGKKKSGSIEARLIKASTEDGSVKIKCSLKANAKERDTLPDDMPFDVVEGDGTNIGDELCLGKECFYVISNDGYDLKLLAKYNLYVGGTNETGRYVEYGEEATGLQDSNMKGVTSNESPRGTLAFSDSNNINYEGSYVKAIVENYTDYINNLYDVGAVGGLLSISVLEDLYGNDLTYGNKLNETFPNYKWLYDRSYWMENVSSPYVDVIASTGFYYTTTVFANNTSFGVRPLLTIHLKDKPSIMQAYQYADKFWNYRSSITKIVFENQLNEKEEYTYKFDVSELQDGNIMSYLVANEDDSSTYTLYIQENDKIIANPNSSYYFSNFSKLQSIEGLEYFDTSLVKNMNSMFSYSNKIVDLDLKFFNTERVTDMSYMFNNLASLKSLDLSNFNTENVTNMFGMFMECVNLVTLNISSFDTSKVTDMAVMFDRCKSLQELNLYHFNTSNVTTMRAMFCQCISLKSLNISNFNTIQVTDMADMFSECEKLESLNVSSFNTSNVTDMSDMFSYCRIIENIYGLENFDTNKVKSMTRMFSCCEKIKKLNLSSFSTSNVTSMSFMFYNCQELEETNVSNFDTLKVTNMESMFEYCLLLNNLDLSSFYTTNVSSMQNMFRYCTSLANLDIRNFDISKVSSDETAYRFMFTYLPSTAIVKVKSATEQQWILSLKIQGSGYIYRPSEWTTDNIIIV